MASARCLWRAALAGAALLSGIDGCWESEPEPVGDRAWRAPDAVIRDVVPADLDGDGRDELIVSLGPLTLFDHQERTPRQQGFVSLGAEGTVGDFRAFEGPPMLGITSAADDWDGDGDLDVLLVGTGQLQYHRSEGGRFVEASPALPADARDYQVRMVTSGDVTGDDVPELVLFGSYSWLVLSWTGPGFAVIHSRGTLVPGPMAGRGQGVAACVQDVDGDGHGDIVLLLLDRLEVHRNAGDGRGFELHSETLLEARVKDALFDDLDCEPGDECLVLLEREDQGRLEVYAVGEPVRLVASVPCGRAALHCLAVLPVRDGCRRSVLIPIWRAEEGVLVDLEARVPGPPRPLRAAWLSEDDLVPARIDGAPGHLLVVQSAWETGGGVIRLVALPDD